MPDPIRTSLILPPALLDDEHVVEVKAEGPGATETPLPVVGTGPGASLSAGGGGFCDARSLGAAGASVANDAAAGTTASGNNRPGMPLKRDPYGRDGGSSSGRVRLDAKQGWSVEPLCKYLKDVACQIDANLRDECLPTAERLEAFVSRLVVNTQRQLKHAPRKERHTLQALFSRRFQKFWDYARNQKVRSTTPEELKWALVTLVENLFAEFTATGPDALLLAQPKPVHYHHCAQLLRSGVDAAGC